MVGDGRELTDEGIDVGVMSIEVEPEPAVLGAPGRGSGRVELVRGAAPGDEQAADDGGVGGHGSDDRPTPCRMQANRGPEAIHW